MRRRIAELVAIAAATVSSAATGQSKIAPPPPPYIGAYQPKGVDEIGLWRQEDEDERALANSPILIRDEALNSYVKNVLRSEEHTSELQSLMRISYAVLCLKK